MFAFVEYLSNNGTADGLVISAMDLILRYKQQPPSVQIGWVLIFVLAVLFWISIRKTSGVLQSAVPEAFSWPWFGNVDVLKEPPHIALTKLSRKYGPVFSVSTGGGKSFVIVNDNEQVRKAAAQFAVAFSGKPQSTTTQLTTQGCHRDHGKRWQKRRTIILKTVRNLFQLSGEMLQEVYNTELIVLMKKIQGYQSKACNPRDETKHFIARTMWRMVYGRGAEPDFATDRKLLEIAHKIDFYSGNAGVFSLLNRFPTIQKYLSTAMKNYKDFSDTLDRFVDESTGKRMSQGLTMDPHSDVFDYMLDGAKSLTEEDEELYGLNSSVLIKGLGDFIRSGTEAPSVAIQWLWLILAKYPDIQEKMAEELKPFQKYSTDEFTVVCELGSSSTPYTDAVFYESLRYTSTAPFAKRLTLGKVEVGGFTIPVGSTVIINNHAMNFNPKHWEEPELFKPERFLHPDGSFNSGVLERFIPFGVGRRRCFGENIGRVLTVASIATLVANFKISPKGNNVIDMRPLSGITLSPVYQDVVFTPRYK